MALEGVFIDAGKTLLYEKPPRFEIYAQAARQRGGKLDGKEMLELMRRAHRELPREIDGHFRYSEGWFSAYIERVFHHHLGIPRGELPDLQREIFSRFADPETFGIYPGGVELLDVLKNRGLAVGIISNWSQRLPRILDGLGLSKRLDFVLASAIERVEKPAPEIFARACARAGVPASRALHAGDDEEKDVRGALAAGLLAVRVDHEAGAGKGKAGDPATERPCVGSLTELAEWIAHLP